MSDLTKSGWPRPIVGGWPIPWVSPVDDLARMDEARAAACASGAVCAVCGEGYQDGEVAYALVNSAARPEPGTFDVQAMDNGILHKKCLQLSLARCPELGRLKAQGELQIVKTTGNSARVVIAEDEKVRAVLDGSTCEVSLEVD